MPKKIVKPDKRQTGVWIDRSKAVIATLTDEGMTTTCILSRVDRQPRRRSGRVSRNEQPIAIDDKAMRVWRVHLNKYYDDVISHIAHDSAVLIFGPGMAKHELAKRINEKGLMIPVADVETADKMSERQVAAMARYYFTTRYPTLGGSHV
jgi:hypothetical protein